MPVNDQHPWSTADPAGDAGGIEELGRGLASVSEDPSLHVQRLEEARDLIERSEDPATAPHGPGGRIELVESDAGNVVAVIAGELVCRTDELAMVSDVLSGLGAEVRDELTSDTTGLTLLRLAGDAPVSRVVEACIVAGATAGPNEVTIEGGGWRLKALSSPEPTSRGLGRRPEHGPGAGVTVGVIDGGFTPDPGLRDDGWLDAVVGPDAPIDPLDGDAVPGLDAGSGHGTFVTGIVRQVAPGCMVRQYRAVGTLGLGNSWALMAAVTRAAADGCDIVNLSLGFEAVGNLGSLAVTAAVQAIAPQVLVVAAAGNGGGTTPTYPAAQKGVVAVGALRGDLGPTTWSNRGPWVDFSCVGEGVVSTFVDGTEEATAKPTATTFSGPDPIALWSGTSFAAPQVGGRLAALLSEGLGPLDAVEALRAESRSDTGGVPDPSFGYRLRIL